MSQVEPYMDRKQLAGLLGVSTWTVDRLVKEGMPSYTWGMRVRRFRASEALEWLQAREPQGAA
jgi:excisionase family DNA binding protein